MRPDGRGWHCWLGYSLREIYGIYICDRRSWHYRLGIMHLHSPQGDDMAIGVCQQASVATCHNSIVLLYECMTANKLKGPHDANRTMFYFIYIDTLLQGHSSPPDQ